GTDVAGSQLLVATVRVEGTGVEQVFDEPQVAPGPLPEPAGRRRLWVGGEWREVPVYHRDTLAANATVAGPAIVIEANGTTVIDDGWRGRVNQWGHLLLESREAQRGLGLAPPASVREPDPVRLEVFNRLFMHIAEQMG